jgi:hypothetical protein
MEDKAHFTARFLTYHFCCCPYPAFVLLLLLLLLLLIRQAIWQRLHHRGGEGTSHEEGRVAGGHCTRPACRHAIT